MAFLAPLVGDRILVNVFATPAPESFCGIKQLGRYRLMREIGRGAMGVVYLATDPVIGRSVALKTVTFPPDLDEHERADRFERFAREAKAAGVLSHPGIVTVYDAGRDDSSGLSYIAMEYIAGRTLIQEFAGARAIPECRVLALARALAEALSHAHQRGIIHRDLKPANILLGEDGSIKITDFGVARMESSELTRDGQSIGSPAYMSPEQALGRTADGRSDLFSLGVILYEALTGKKPFTGVDTSAVLYQIVHEKPAALSLVNSQLSPAWDRIVARLMSKHPEDRYQDARALLGDLEALLFGQRQTAPRPADEDASETVLHPSTPPGRRAAMNLLPHVRSLLNRSPGLPGRHKVAIATVGLVAAIVVGVALGIGGSSRCLVGVELRHGLEAGSLQIDLDGRNVVNRSFRGESQATRVFGKDFFKRTGGIVEDSFLVPPGAHEVSVHVRADSGDGDWLETVRRDFEKGDRYALHIRVATAFSSGLRLEWEAVRKDVQE